MIDRIDDIDLLDPVERDHPLLRGCVAWWLPLPNLYGSTKYWDVIGRNHGTLTGGPTWRGNGSISYDGVNDYITCGDVVKITGNLSLVCNFAGSTQTNRGLIGKYNTTVSGRSYALATESAGGTTALRFSYQQNGGSFSGSQLVSSSSGVLNGSERIAVAVFTPSTSAQIFIDGLLDAINTTSVPSSVANTTASLEIGRFNANNTGAFAGVISRAMIFDRSVDADWVAQDYEQARQGYPDVFRRLTRKAYSLPAAPPPAITRRPFFSDWGSVC